MRAIASFVLVPLFLLLFNSAGSSLLGTQVLVSLSIGFLVFIFWGVLTDIAPRPVLFMFCIYMIMFYMLPGYTHVNSGYFPFYSIRYASESIFFAVVLIAIFSLSVFAGYQFAVGGKEKPRPVSLSPGLTIAATLFMMALAMASAGAVGFGAFLASRGEKELYLDISPLTVLLLTLAGSGAIFSVILSIALWREKSSAFQYVLLPISIGINLFINNPMTVARFGLAANAFMIIFSFMNFTRKLRVILLALFLVCQFTVFPFLSAISRGDPGDWDNFSPFTYFAESGDFDGLQSTVNVVQFVESRGLQWGRSLGSAIFFFIPRTTWPEKSPGLGVEAAIEAGYPFTNISSPMPSELYVDFGIPGLVLLSFAFGMAMRWLDDLYGRASESGDVISKFIVSIAAGFIFIILRGTLVAVLGPAVFSMALAMCLKVIVVPAAPRRRTAVDAPPGLGQLSKRNA